MKKIIFAALFIASLFGIHFSWVLFFPSYKHSTTIYIPPKTSFGTLTHQLLEKKLISYPVYFKLFAKLTGKSSKIQVGEYHMEGILSNNDILNKIVEGDRVVHRVVFPEGTNIYEMAEILEKKEFFSKEEFLKWATDSKFIESLMGLKLETLEGYLFPETYYLNKYSNAKSFIEKMVKTFFHQYALAKKDKPTWKLGKKKKGLTLHQIVTLASIIEKETGAEEERPLISSVFHNRLLINMKLQTDPTVLYGILDKTKKPKLNITRKDLRTPTRYNTYTQKGLPFGPISNPGRKALQAAMQPEQSSYLFFVSRNDGTHLFTENYANHKKGVKKYQLNRAARKNKSWRDLKKRKKKPQKKNP